MEFDPDRLAKLAGISGADAATTTAAPHNPASAPGGLIRESAASSRRAPESKEVKQLRQLIRAEASQMIREMRSQRAGNRLSESVAMGFYGPGFGDSRQGILGGPMGAPSGSSWLLENEGENLDTDAVKSLKSEIASKESEIEGVLAAAGIKLSIDDVMNAIKKVDPEDVIKKAKEISGKQGMEEGWKASGASAGVTAASLATLFGGALMGLDKTDPAHVALAVVASFAAPVAAAVATHVMPSYGRGKPARDPNP